MKDNQCQNIVFVFDGKKNPIKSHTNDERAYARSKKIDQGIKYN